MNINDIDFQQTTEPQMGYDTVLSAGICDICSIPKMMNTGACLKHKSNNMRYLQWHEWAEMKIKHGAKQKQCPKCGRWFFKSEY